MIKMSAMAVVMAAGAMASAATAQTVTAPSAVNPLLAHGVHTAGNAAALAPTAHEILAPGVAGTVPATRPFTQGVTSAGYYLSQGVTKTGDNIAKNGLTVAPTGGVTPSHRALEVNTAKTLVNQAGGVVTQAVKVPK